MNLNQLHYFVMLAHMEHYTKAAEVLAITQPSLSHAISMLEQELKTSLFEKRGRNVVLTKYGKVFLKYVEESLGILETGIKMTRALTSETSGEIDLAYIYTQGSVFVPQLVNEFLRQHDDWDVKFHFTVGSTTEIIRGLKEEKYDMAVCSIREKEQGIEFTPIGTEKLVVVVSREHELAIRESISLKETVKYPHIFYDSSQGMRRVVEKLYEEIGSRPEVVQELTEDASIAGLAAQNFGIAIMPRIPILDSLDVKVLEITEPACERHIYLAQLKEKYLTPVAKAFGEYVKEKC